MSHSDQRQAPDPWNLLRLYTSARIAIGRAGASLPTREVLDFSAAHALARDAVASELDIAALEDGLVPLGLPVVRLRSRASDRVEFLKRPDLGRRLDALGAETLKSSSARSVDIALVLADGLSATAVQRHGVPLVGELLRIARPLRWLWSPLCLVTRGRVAIGDEIGELLNARAALIILGERPGLGAADSLGAYLVYGPRIGNTDAQKNCVSNIRPGGLNVPAAAETICYLLSRMLRLRISGVALKDDRLALRLPG